MDDESEYTGLPFDPQDAVSQFDDRDDMDAAIAALEAEGFSTRRIVCEDDAVMLGGIARALDWQAQFGRPLRRLNLDAFADALRGVPSDEDSRVLLVLERFRSFEARDAAAAEGIVEAIRDAAADHLEVNRRLLAFICTDPDDDDFDDSDSAEDGDQIDHDPAEEWLRHG
ncbi:hypothetical protein DRW48_02450 [Paracoccus suum]|uniref:Barstar (barnase inhibitor) domain-containing protein n=1 Tax=Paracoccus suum TaxID=2259340 RepID=A0A344PH45_9RHOB|nr:barstar family protein [Paracoccus suum]AXC48700.1 hypothetical protein DRW48_02450 [Paracoccus suum]